MKPFDLLNDPLQGVNLIEAGAGTGKTFTIAGLYLRLIVEQGLGPERILVVTYTKAATEELKHRIRSRLTTARAVFSDGPYQDQNQIQDQDQDRPPPEAPPEDGTPKDSKTDDPWLKALAEKTADHGLARRRIDHALVEFDRAAIFTIHGFCQRILQQFAFETGHRFQSELIQDVSPMVREIADDFWRRYISKAPEELAIYALDRLKGPEGFAALLDACRYPGIRFWPRTAKPGLTTIAPWRRLARQTRGQWPRVRDEVTALLHSPALNARSYGRCAKAGEDPAASPRGQRIAGVAAAMDVWDGTYPMSKQLAKQFLLLGSDKLAAATKKNHQPPAHPFFDLCQQTLAQQALMEAQLAQYLRYLKLTLLDRSAGQLDDKKARRNVMSFDDLLLNVAGALSDDRNARLVQSIRDLYAAALVDEFQDTDPLQYDIFTGLFGTDPSVLFMIGDPKQAIYSFRGADVYAYLQAAGEASRQFTLERNWRSTPGLVNAVNTVFSNRPNPFGTPEIGFNPAVAARPDGPGHPGEPSLHLWYLESLPNAKDPAVGKPWPRQEATQRIVNAVAARIVELLSRPASFAPEQIAVLTRSHRQARMTKAALVKRQVPAVLYSAGSVFETHEAGELMRVLKAVVTPANPFDVRAALATEMLGCSAGDFEDSPSGGPGAWESRWERFEDYHRCWVAHGFFRMFSRLMRAEQVKSSLLGLPDGERRVTNLLHLGELIQQAEMTQRLSPEGVMKWLAAHMQTERTGTADDQQLRLESDARAVQIITIHKSKGLQFDVVFCPFTWTQVSEDDQLTAFHNPDDARRLTLALGPDIPPAYKRQGMKEELAENLRLLYVALTRARNQCYWIWGRINNTAHSAPAYLLHGPADPADDPEWPEALTRKIGTSTDARLRRELQSLAARSAGSITLAPLPEHDDLLVSGASTPLPGTERSFQRVLDPHWRIASFSSLTAGHGHPPADVAAEPAEKDRDPQDAESAAEESAGEEPLTAHSVFEFPKGTQAGLFFHDLLENWDFNAARSTGTSRDRQALISARLAAYGFESRWLPVVDDLLCDLAKVHLPYPSMPPGKAWFTFQDALKGRRLNEMSFYFPLNRITPEALQGAFALPSGQPSPDRRDFEAALEHLDFAPVEGFLKGYVDLIFEYRGRYYVVDWKSNHLGNRKADYAPDHLQQVMAETHYFLQYHLYVVALDQLLAQRMPDYDYEEHFGGVYYIFLRGISGQDSVTGIHYARPDRTVIRRLRDLMVSI